MKSIRKRDTVENSMKMAAILIGLSFAIYYYVGFFVVAELSKYYLEIHI